jgi:hypothetical protein
MNIIWRMSISARQHRESARARERERERESERERKRLSHPCTHTHTFSLSPLSTSRVPGPRAAFHTAEEEDSCIKAEESPAAAGGVMRLFCGVTVKALFWVLRRGSQSKF